MNNISESLGINGRNECPLLHVVSANDDVSFDSNIFLLKVLINIFRGFELPSINNHFSAFYKKLVQQVTKMIGMGNK